MRYFITLLITCALGQSLSAQSSVCGQFHRKNCAFTDDKAKGNWQYNAQSKSGLFSMGMTSKLRCVIYKGMDYRISVCCEATLGEKLNYKIYDARTNELLFDNKTAEETQTFEFQSVSTRQLVIEVLVPQGATEKEEHKATDAACVGLLIEHKITDKSGFSSY
jgi:hypothetical protein